ncbi:hypothetical protein PPYR_04741 [Photinus pyralis]|uniref:Mutator-like transposase domain-containing protein n=1 Tax=Photinus pyralis TaxID=7054 RepID=A0A5N4AYY4_PHOPY|nr:hypothetical protein PPYR_15098 [Photinus pyralis]KAB0802555.1 hypothetical protein PPYR_04741 [Photinus pyralis]
MSCMSSRMYDTLHQEVCDAWITGMSNAANEEKRLAVQDENLDKNGIPLITVVADGSWSKRSYHNNYNSLSGAAVIIGFRTKKVLFLGVRNKFCTTCKSPKKIRQLPNHISVTKSGVALQLEADIIAEAFSKSVEMYGIVYEKLIADGDRNCYKRILGTHP